ncbi:unnamed protein product, partial [marine sediment metagenome]
MSSTGALTMAGVVLIAVAGLVEAAPVAPAPAGRIWADDLESYGADRSIHGQRGWQARGMDPADGKTPSAAVRVGAGLKGSKALAIWHGARFTAKDASLRQTFDEPLSGTFWISCRVQAPAKWSADLFLDVQAKGKVAARLYAAEGEDGQQRWHVAWSRPYWRIWTPLATRAGSW